MNDVLQSLMNEAIKLLDLDGVIAVNTTKEVEQVMYNQQLVAGIQFNHFSVSLFYFMRIQTVQVQSVVKLFFFSY